MSRISSHSNNSTITSSDSLGSIKMSTSSISDMSINKEKVNTKTEKIAKGVKSQEEKELIGSYIEFIFERSGDIFSDKTTQRLSNLGYNDKIEALTLIVAQDPPPVKYIKFTSTSQTTNQTTAKTATPDSLSAQFTAMKLNRE